MPEHVRVRFLRMCTACFLSGFHVHGSELHLRVMVFVKNAWYILESQNESARVAAKALCAFHEAGMVNRAFLAKLCVQTVHDFLHGAGPLHDSRVLQRLALFVEERVLRSPHMNKFFKEVLQKVRRNALSVTSDIECNRLVRLLKLAIACARDCIRDSKPCLVSQEDVHHCLQALPTPRRLFFRDVQDPLQEACSELRSVMAQWVSA